MVRLTDRPDMTIDVYRGLKQQYNNNIYSGSSIQLVRIPRRFSYKYFPNALERYFALNIPIAVKNKTKQNAR